MTEIQQKINALLALKAQAQTDQDRSRAHIELLRYHYFLSEDDKDSVAGVMKSTLDELDRVPMPPDPLLQRAEELLNRIKSRVPQP
ncbi:hypothetical protein [Spirosoma arcticum]